MYPVAVPVPVEPVRADGIFTVKAVEVDAITGIEAAAIIFAPSDPVENPAKLTIAPGRKVFAAVTVSVVPDAEIAVTVAVRGAVAGERGETFLPL